MYQCLFTIKNIQALAEMLKMKNGMSPVIVSNIFLVGTEIITAFHSKIIYFYLLYKRYITAMKTYPT